MLLFWGLAAVVVGPVLGLAAWSVRSRRPVLGPVTVGCVSGILIGEGLYGLTVVAGTTSSGYWIAQIVVGLSVLGGVLTLRFPGIRPAALSVFSTAVVAGLFLVMYRQDLIALILT